MTIMAVGLIFLFSIFAYILTQFMCYARARRALPSKVSIFKLSGS